MHILREICNDSLHRNSFFLILTQLLNVTFGFLFWVIAARYYTPDEVGAISALVSSMLLLSMISTLGFPTAFIFYLPRNRENSRIFINSCITSSIAASFIFSFIFVLGIDLWASPLKTIFQDMKFVFLFAAITAVMTTSTIISSAFVAGRRSSFHMMKEMIFSLLKILPLKLFSVFGAIGIFFSWGIGGFVAVAVGFFCLSLVWKDYLPFPMLDPIIRNMAKYAGANYLAEILFYLPRLVLPIMILNMLSIEYTGYFYIAMMIASLLYGISQSVSTSLLAESSEDGELWDKVEKSIKLNAVLLFPGIIIFFLFGKFILNIFNPFYAQNAFAAMIILTISSIPVSINTIFIAVRNAQKRISTIIEINTSIAAITLAIAVPLIRSSGIEGAAAAFLISNTLTSLLAIPKLLNLRQKKGME